MKIGMSCIGVVVLAQIASGQQCPGDLNGDGKVTIDEIIKGVNSALNQCSATGERFADDRDGTITDSQTGLVWEKKVTLDGAPDFANLQDADNSYPWAGQCSMNAGKYCQPTSAAATACAAGAEGDITGCAACSAGDGVCNTAAVAFNGDPNSTVWTWVVALNAANFGNHNDWQLAKRSQLESIIDYSDGTPPAVNVAFQGASCGATCTDVTSALCGCTASYYYQSSTTFAGDPSSVWIVDFRSGSTGANGKGGSLNVRAVRDGR